MNFKWTLRLFGLTPLCMLLSIVLPISLREAFVPALFFYPAFFIFGIPSNGLLFSILIIVQFPLYGLMLDGGKRISRQFLASVLVILIHTTQILIATFYTGFWK